jgi:hypothetical protein
LYTPFGKTEASVGVRPEAFLRFGRFINACQQYKQKQGPDRTTQEGAGNPCEMFLKHLIESLGGGQAGSEVAQAAGALVGSTMTASMTACLNANSELAQLIANIEENLACGEAEQRMIAAGRIDALGAVSVSERDGDEELAWERALRDYHQTSVSTVSLSDQDFGMEGNALGNTIFIHTKEFAHNTNPSGGG